MTPVLLIHGGAWAMPDDAVAAHENGITNALAAGYALLEQGASAVDAVEAAVAVMEDDETFDAGRGSFLTQDGRVQMDALLMNGENLRTGGVACVERLRNPIRAARLVLDKSPHVYFVGTGAERFARQHGMPLCDNMELVVRREQERLYRAQADELAGLPDETFSGNLDSHDTVGAVALDKHGNLAAGTSTGGTLNKAPGRVGDSSLIGCGCYADNLSAAVSLTGWGEPIMKLVLGKWAVDRVAAGASPEKAAEEAIAYLYSRLGGHGGIILLGPDGRFGMAHNTPRMAWGLQTSEGRQIGVTQRALLKSLCPAGRAPYAGGVHFVEGIPLRVALPLVAKQILCRPQGGRPEGGIPPTKWAPPAQGARPAGHILSDRSCTLNSHSCRTSRRQRDRSHRREPGSV